MVSLKIYYIFYTKIEILYTVKLRDAISFTKKLSCTFPSWKQLFLYIFWEKKRSDGRVRNQMVARWTHGPRNRFYYFAGISVSKTNSNGTHKLKMLRIKFPTSTDDYRNSPHSKTVAKTPCLLENWKVRNF